MEEHLEGVGPLLSVLRAPFFSASPAVSRCYPPSTPSSNPALKKKCVGVGTGESAQVSHPDRYRRLAAAARSNNGSV